MASPWIDISYPIENGIPQWPGDPPIGISRLCEVGPTSVAQVSKLDLVSHFMTHVDAPAHFIKDGVGVDALGLDHWSGDAVVVEVDGDVIEERHVPENCEGLCILFKTRNGDLWKHPTFQENYVYISGPAAQALARRGTKLVGVDYMSVDQFGTGEFPAHYAILGNGITILEAIDLRNVAPGNYELVAFPLKIVGCDGSPVRAAIRPR
jgi:arylformamidase